MLHPASVDYGPLAPSAPYEEGSINASADPAIYKEVVVCETAQTPHRVSAVERRAFEPLEQPDETYPTIFVDVDKTLQTIEGFGGAFTDAGADNFALSC